MLPSFFEQHLFYICFPKVTGMAPCDSSQYDMTRKTPQRYNIVIRKRWAFLALRTFKDIVCRCKCM